LREIERERDVRRRRCGDSRREVMGEPGADARTRRVGVVRGADARTRS
jgi:hypothetical protein